MLFPYSQVTWILERFPGRLRGAAGHGLWPFDKSEETKLWKPGCRSGCVPVVIPPVSAAYEMEMSAEAMRSSTVAYVPNFNKESKEER